MDYNNMAIKDIDAKLNYFNFIQSNETPFNIEFGSEPSLSVELSSVCRCTWINDIENEVSTLSNRVSEFFNSDNNDLSSIISEIKSPIKRILFYLCVIDKFLIKDNIVYNPYNSLSNVVLKSSPEIKPYGPTLISHNLLSRLSDSASTNKIRVLAVKNDSIDTLEKLYKPTLETPDVNFNTDTDELIYQTINCVNVSNIPFNKFLLYNEYIDSNDILTYINTFISILEKIKIFDLTKYLCFNEFNGGYTAGFTFMSTFDEVDKDRKILTQWGCVSPFTKFKWFTNDKLLDDLKCNRPAMANNCKYYITNIYLNFYNTLKTFINTNDIQPYQIEYKYKPFQNNLFYNKPNDTRLIRTLIYCPNTSKLDTLNNNEIKFDIYNSAGTNGSHAVFKEIYTSDYSLIDDINFDLFNINQNEIIKISPLLTLIDTIFYTWLENILTYLINLYECHYNCHANNIEVAFISKLDDEKILPPIFDEKSPPPIINILFYLLIITDNTNNKKVILFNSIALSRSSVDNDNSNFIKYVIENGIDEEDTEFNVDIRSLYYPNTLTNAVLDGFIFNNDVTISGLLDNINNTATTGDKVKNINTTAVCKNKNIVYDDFSNFSNWNTKSSIGCTISESYNEINDNLLNTYNGNISVIYTIEYTLSTEEMYSIGIDDNNIFNFSNIEYQYSSNLLLNLIYDNLGFYNFYKLNTNSSTATNVNDKYYPYLAITSVTKIDTWSNCEYDDLHKNTKTDTYNISNNSLDNNIIGPILLNKFNLDNFNNSIITSIKYTPTTITNLGLIIKFSIINLNNYTLEYNTTYNIYTYKSKKCDTTSTNFKDFYNVLTTLSTLSSNIDELVDDDNIYLSYYRVNINTNNNDTYTFKFSNCSSYYAIRSNNTFYPHNQEFNFYISPFLMDNTDNIININQLSTWYNISNNTPSFNFTKDKNLNTEYIHLIIIGTVDCTEGQFKLEIT